MSHKGNDDNGQGDMNPSSINSEPPFYNKVTMMSETPSYEHDHPSSVNFDGSSGDMGSTWLYMNQSAGICPLISECMH
eukprot:8128674-Karenia_brevis.AAC.1